jgi:hypothetical protein
MIGNGRKITFDGRILVTGNSANIPAAFTTFNKTNFPGLTFIPTLDGLLTFGETTGEIVLLRHGLLQISAIVNFDSTVPTRIDVAPFRDKGTGYEPLNARTGEITVLTNQQLDFHGIIHAEKGDKIKFDVCDNSNVANFVTEVLPNSAVVPAAIIDFTMWVL